MEDSHTCAPRIQESHHRGNIHDTRPPESANAADENMDGVYVICNGLDQTAYPSPRYAMRIGALVRFHRTRCLMTCPMRMSGRDFPRQKPRLVICQGSRRPWQEFRILVEGFARI